MRWLVVLALVACNGKSKPPALAEIDRTCTQDGDCMLSGQLDCCDRSCGGHIGEPVSVKGWDKAIDGREERCKGVECPHVTCPKAPDCRDEGIAICKRGRCEREIRKTAACGAANDDLACEQAADCFVFVRKDCCSTCSGPVMNREALERAMKQDTLHCGMTDQKCPILQCPELHIDCVAGECVVKP